MKHVNKQPRNNRGYHRAATSASISDDPSVPVPHNLVVVGASGLDVTRLLALVANLLATGRLLGTVARVVARLAAVVAAHAVDALTCEILANKCTIFGTGCLTRHVAVAAARVARLASTATVVVVVAAAVATAIRGLGAMAGNVAHLTTLFMSVRSFYKMGVSYLLCSTQWTGRCLQRWGTREKGGRVGRTCSRTCSPS